MKKYLKYFWYVIRHKWYVGVECFKKGAYWRGLVHDISKLLPDEFIPYARHFYGSKEGIKRGRDKSFDFAFLLHQKRNKHHWQWWILPADKGGVRIFEVAEPYLTEMVCDWIGAGKAQGHFSPKDDPLREVRNWWEKNNKKMQLHKKTRKYLEKVINPKYLLKYE
jgi:hypothetical protein